MDWGSRLAGTYIDRPALAVGVVRPGVILRYGLYLALLVASLMFYVWSRVDVRVSAGALDRAVVQLSELQAEHERLQLELAVRRDLGRLDRAGEVLGLVSEVAVVDVSMGAKR